TGYQTEAEATNQYWLTIGVAALATILLAGLVILMLRVSLRPTVIHGDNYVGRALFLDKETNSYSLSKFQFYVWTLVAIFGYVYLLISKNIFQHYFGLPAVPAGLPGIVGIAGGTAVGSQIVTNINGPKGSGQIKPSLADFVTTGDVVAAERVQFFVWTIIGALGFVLAVVRLDPRVLKELPDVPSSLLAISGLSAFGYLGGKLARNPGPVISEVMVHAGPDPEAVTAAATTTAAPATTPAAAPTTTIPPGVDNTTTVDPNATTTTTTTLAPAGVPDAAAAPVAAAGNATASYGIIELRGRMLSQDANFRVSLGEESGPDDVDISFDALVPSPNDDKHLKKPRIMEKDDDSTDKTMAKRLLLVIDVSPKTRAQFVQATKHTITIINPDSQKAVFKFEVPESQAPA
ncbi:MAG TPA: hypothetical protein VHW24_08680, partial [Bryobacteraceae bacterium]|nr:hypothetical protein [Bryobacteraceae bacterium]